MFKKSRRKIIAAIMSVLVLLWGGTLGVIYASSYFEMAKQNEDMLKAHAEMYKLSGAFDDEFLKKIPAPGGDRENAPAFDKQSPRFKLSVFYTAAVSYDGEILEIKNEAPAVHSDDELEELAQSIINGDRKKGSRNNLAFYSVDKGGYNLVAFMDNTVINESAETLLRYTLIFGGAALVVFFFLSMLLARKIVQPLEESYQKQKQFISDAGHELKTPVSVVGASAELLLREIGENKWLDNIQYENERMGVLVGQLLELARTENVEPQTERMDFSRLVAGEALSFESVAFEKGLALNTDITNDIFVDGNGTQLKQLVSILLDNAVHHNSGSGEVRLSLTKERGSARLSVINSGEQISPEQCEKIFERFYRVDTARSGDDSHYGLGLAIAKAIVTSHKGRINVQCFDGLVEFKVQIPTA